MSRSPGHFCLTLSFTRYAGCYRCKHARISHYGVSAGHFRLICLDLNRPCSPILAGTSNVQLQVVAHAHLLPFPFHFSYLWNLYS